ncbi:phosphate propanoyltransferase [Lysinibacillus fusiformis]|uniref:phosphate propanoyltransferase n=1 Tax=Lysinibacillus fusiformis TaxID=28031 RepID=UPI0004D5DD6E|nr:MULTISPECIES: phosphate propanoyltransferase [Lysinibacillus]KEK10468.1 acetate kinase [Lysinibacillus sphaericus]MCK1987462.1 phosphate propanoyltransferase [Lysinibacillus fusiformis]UXJ70386.1 phosphate propanoyltransferase [Lysinibacillus fusiformis]WEA40736.1 phosphate propanoyltransferase [Lysinibacillus fusiformis]WRT00187.1 phosphate propanoyltransferase [Lysinibacillus fusiformis]
MQENLVQKIVEEVLQQVLKNQSSPPHDGKIPIGVSARHVHLAQAEVEQLFGENYQLTPKFELSQPGQFAAEETVVIAGPKGSIERVRILGPARSLSQVEVSWTDAMKLGIKPPLRISGDIQGSSPVTLIGPKGSVVLNEGLIIAQAHIHMSPEDSAKFNVMDGQSVQIKVEGIRPIILSNVVIRVSERYRLEMHIDTDEANAGLIQQGTVAEIVQHQVNEQPIPVKEQSPVVAKVEKPAIYHYDKKLLSQLEVLEIDAQEIVVPKKTIVTALAYDKLRELNKTLTIRSE